MTSSHEIHSVTEDAVVELGGDFTGRSVEDGLHRLVLAQHLSGKSPDAVPLRDAHETGKQE